MRHSHSLECTIHRIIIDTVRPGWVSGRLQSTSQIRSDSETDIKPKSNTEEVSKPSALIKIRIVLDGGAAVTISACFCWGQTETKVKFSNLTQPIFKVLCILLLLCIVWFSATERRQLTASLVRLKAENEITLNELGAAPALAGEIEGKIRFHLGPKHF